MRLTARDAAKAARYNIKNAWRVGWAQRYAQVASVLELGGNSVTPQGFAQAVADWQGKRPPLKPDGMLGRRSWARLEPATRFCSAVHTPFPSWLQARPRPAQRPLVPAPQAGGEDAPWMQVAQAQLQGWQTEIDGWGADRDRTEAEQYLDWDEKYFAA